MSAPESITTTRAAYQPFECSICQRRFTRHENLKRHAALHSKSHQETPLSCTLCPSTFSRQDLRIRHMKRKHPDVQEERDSNADPLDATSTSKKFRSENNADDDQEISFPEYYSDGGVIERAITGSSNEHSSGVDQTSMGSRLAYRADFSFNTFTESNEASNASDATPTPQPYASDTQYIDHFLGGNDTTETRGPSAAIASSQNEFGGPSHAIMMPAAHTNDFSQTSRIFSPSASDATEGSSIGPSPNTLRFRGDWFPSPDQTVRGLDLYFQHISCVVPIIHPITYKDALLHPVLILSMLALGYHYGEDPVCDDVRGSGEVLAVRCFHRARVLLHLNEETLEDESKALALVQAYLLVEICAMMYLCGKDSSYALKSHPRMIRLARSSGILQPKPDSSSKSKDLESLWREFIEAEALKRTAFAVHQFDAMLYQFLSMPRSLSHLEIKHTLPCPAETWSADSAAEWAHQQLTRDRSNTMVSYVEAVRLFLSPEPKLSSLPAFDPYGAINIAQFLISSAREISGWSAMTGRVSLERFEPLRSSLEALRPYIRARAGTARSVGATVSEATWEIAMIELQMWSPSHTGGVVGESVDRLLEEWAASCLGPWSETLFNASKALQPHVDWYLQYLDETVNIDFEPPWITLYAYKAFLIAWQLLRGGVKEAMQVVQISDGDQQQAISWAKSVFGRRGSWGPGRLIITSLDDLVNRDNIRIIHRLSGDT